MATAATLPHVETQPKTGIWSWITTVDHKRVGILYGTTAFFFFRLRATTATRSGSTPGSS